MNRIVHYCWFGGRQLSNAGERSLASWRRHASQFKIVRWDESNSPLDACPFVSDAFAAKRWAFVADYVRFYAIYMHGGVYMDVGSELVRDISPLLDQAPFSAIEELTLTVNPGLVLCAEAGDPIVGEVLDRYAALPFENTDEFLRAHTVNEMLTGVLEELGYKRCDELQSVAGWTLLPSRCFNPVYGFGGFHIKCDTYSIHRYSGSWTSPVDRRKKQFVNAASPFIGRRPAQVVGRVIAELIVNGPVDGAKNLIVKTKSKITGM